MDKLLGFCGLDCMKCEARTATRNDDDALREKVAREWSELNGVTITPEMINCDGCREDGRKTPFCEALCPIRKCALEKGVPTCGQCSELASCDTLKMITAHNEEALSNLKEGSYKPVDMEKYYRRGVFRHFSKDCKCSVSMTARIDVTELIAFSRRTGTKFYLDFLYVLARALNSRGDYKLRYLWETDEVIRYDAIHPAHYVFHEDTETFTVVYSRFYEDFSRFYREAEADLERAKQTREYGLDQAGHPNWFDASFIPWVSYDSLNIELPDGFLYLAPIVNWGAYREENGRFMMPVTVRLNHAAADGYLIAKVFRLIEDGIRMLIEQKGTEEI